MNDTHPLSRSTRQTRSALLTLSLAAISFAVFSDPCDSNIQTLFGISISTTFASFIFLLVPPYLAVSFVAASRDDLKNAADGIFQSRIRALASDALEKNIDRLAEEIREQTRQYLNSIETYRKNKNAEFSSLHELKFSSGAPTDKVSVVLADWFCRRLRAEISDGDSLYELTGNDIVNLNGELKKQAGINLKEESQRSLLSQYDSKWVNDIQQIRNQYDEGISVVSAYSKERKWRTRIIELGVPIAIFAISFGVTVASEFYGAFGGSCGGVDFI